MQIYKDINEEEEVYKKFLKPDLPPLFVAHPLYVIA